MYSRQEGEGEPQVKRIEKGDKKYTGSAFEERRF